VTRVGSTREARAESLWVRVGGGFEEVASGRRHGPADPASPPPDGPWEGLWHGGRLVGWTPPGTGGRSGPRRAVEEGERVARERRARLLGRLGHKLRSSTLALKESARQAANGRQELMDQLYGQAVDVCLRARALEAVALDPQDPPRPVVIGAVLNLAAAGADRRLPGDAVVRAPEPAVVDALTRAYEWMGGAGSTITAETAGSWWRLVMTAAPGRRPLPVPEMGEPLVRHMVEAVLDGWLDTTDTGRAVIYLARG
jgi:hypothetical protein